ncbi:MULTISPECIES: alpha/beta hydrolase [unclassified Streptomyces]|uniref:alpha/beta hydrolase n=1 Tax=unclassified Streptomyces TaxID=2593676 RepID=UPI002E2A33C5|nr:alpha/beta hydrolase-fold protein [Streptomyces sp. NBC_01429]
MGLTSRKVLALAVVLAVLLFVLTVWLWPRLSRRTPRAVAGRVGLLFATQVSIFAAVALVANQYFLFYGTWGDLFGQEQQLGAVVGRAAADGKNVTVMDTQHAPVPGSRQPSVSGQIQKIAVSGRKSGIDSTAYVYLPPQYFQPQFKKQKFPAAVVLTGYPGVAENLIKGLNYPTTAWQLAKANKMQPMILVMLRPTVAPPRDTECVDVPGGPQTETFLAKDVPTAVSRAYRVKDVPRSWGVIGNSTGGYCALKIAMRHPEQFSVGVGLSAYYKAAEDPTTGDLFQGDRNLRNRSDLLWSLDHLPQGESSLLVTSSRKGERNLKDTETFISKVKAPSQVSSIILPSGAHNFNTWRREIPPALVWMSGRLSGA